MKRLALIGIAAVAAWLLPYGLGGYAIHVADVAIIFAILAIGLGLTMGVAGQINLAQVAFFGVGAYTVAILTTEAGLGFWTASALAVLTAVVFGVLTGIPALRMQSHYLGIVTLGLALAFTNWVTNSTIAGRAEGISDLPVPPMFGIDLSSGYLFYYVELVVFAIALAFALLVTRSPLGRRLRAMRDDDLAAGALGAEIPLLRMTAFVLSGLYGGLAGVLYAGLIRFVAPESFNIANMFLLLAMVIIGGRSSILGCVVGAVALSLVREALLDASGYAQLGYGLVVVLVVVFAPKGLAGLPGQIRALLRGRQGGSRAQLGAFRPYEPAPAATEEGVALDVREVTKRFKGLVALDKVSLTVPTGQIRGIVGPNGSGKTTLFNVISGFYDPTEGTVALGGREVTGLAPYRLSLRGVARTFQNLRLFEDLSVRENLLLALDRTRTTWIWRYPVLPWKVLGYDRALHRRTAELLDRFGLAEVADAEPRSLPYGIQRRIELARAMAMSPELLLLDEPAAGLNGEEVRQLADIVRSIRDSGVTVIIIEHNMGLVMSLCDQVTVLSSGRVIADGPPAEVAVHPDVVAAYLGDSMAAPTEESAEAAVEEATR
ncbi:branched-chain amino acid ABC transporter ATP-binding protein/permease [Nonomuraea gerenzanensis]|uniref:Branched-chain amino acid transport ATP-binding protein LivG (TC 3.A.1.4.1) n=1 Tax=Nonomuraea gerenzanensis TaxID=93944 RepID=A0A1M4EFT6_9ACTN|nr:branched-chain amino acid ABC transporter ATP-binding protein/permease [Nonomuraea gerenzanensis]UBU09413.1 branched-chain amino acid ABC transporter ATP-binding protein/permease [Nonomuraea gerenzanensis]SBO97827.1 Branched-chain amino acid transport ATP-binding protein LivG (TC 3.A.1.4.1) [Nonomuraea gerenzanensis]